MCNRGRIKQMVAKNTQKNTVTYVCERKDYEEIWKVMEGNCGERYSIAIGCLDLAKE